MRAALLREAGGVPEPGEVDEPGGGSLLDVSAAALNPLDVAVASGRFYGGSPELPYVPGCEAVGRLDSDRVYVFRGGLGVRRSGTLAERVEVGDALRIPVGEDIPDEVALVCGIAGLAGWLPLTWRAPVRKGDRVLVLGATGTAGAVAVQAARLLGAERVVAAGRDSKRLAETRELGADATIDLAGENLAEAFRTAAGGDGPTLVFDPLWDGPLAAAVEAAAPGARVVQVGQSAGPESTLRSSDVRGKQLDVLGYSNFAAPEDVVRDGYRELLRRATGGEISFKSDTFPLERITEAWQRQTKGPGTKIVVKLRPLA